MFLLSKTEAVGVHHHVVIWDLRVVHTIFR